MFGRFRNITKQEIMNWIIQTIVQLIFVLMCMGAGYIITGIFGVEDKKRIDYSVFIAFACLCYLVKEKFLPKDFLEVKKFEEIIAIILLAIIAVCIIYALVS